MKRALLLIVCISLLLCLVACGGEKTPDEPVVQYSTFAGHTDLEIFQDIPAPQVEDLRIAENAHYGADNYLISVNGTFLKDYQAYLKVLEESGFTKYADNGTTGLGKGVVTATYVKDDLTLEVTLVTSWLRTYIIAAKGQPLSPNLIYSDDLKKDIIPGAKTTLTMNQVKEYGNCFVIQLKNGHFIVNDGGWVGDLNTLLLYLEEEAPEGQKPVVDAWFISHEHGDHAGILSDAMTAFGLDKRLSVEGFYVNEVSPEIEAATNGDCVSYTRSAAKEFVTTAGTPTPVYRPHAGQKLYFCDIVVDVPYTQELITPTQYTANLNASSTWLMYNIEGQKFLLAGDTELVNQEHVKEIYSTDPEYMDVDIMNAHHHGLNLFDTDLGYYNVETILYSTWGVYSIYWPNEEQNLELQREHCLEYYSYLEGGKRITFPYTLGEIENIDPWYADITERLVERQAQWLKNAGLTYDYSVS